MGPNHHTLEDANLAIRRRANGRSTHEQSCAIITLQHGLAGAIVFLINDDKLNGHPGCFK